MAPLAWKMSSWRLSALSRCLSSCCTLLKLQQQASTVASRQCARGARCHCRGDVLPRRRQRGLPPCEPPARRRRVRRRRHRRRRAGRASQSGIWRQEKVEESPQARYFTHLRHLASRWPNSTNNYITVHAVLKMSTKNNFHLTFIKSLTSFGSFTYNLWKLK